MKERNISIQQIEAAFRRGELFAYVHENLVKIGYYDSASKVFIAVDQLHKKVLTLIHGVPEQYVQRLLAKR